MGWFSRRKKEKEQSAGAYIDHLNKTSEGHLLVTTTCPVCSGDTFYRVDFGLFNGEKIDVRGLVGKETGTCRKCGSICFGKIYKGRGDLKALISQAVYCNGIARILSEQNLFSFAKEAEKKGLKKVLLFEQDEQRKLSGDEAAFDISGFLQAVRDSNPGNYEESNIREFLRIVLLNRFDIRTI